MAETANCLKGKQMKVSEVYTGEGKYLKAADLQGKRVTVTIQTTAYESMKDDGTEMKVVVYFQGKEKGLALNKTNAETIAYFHGDDTEMWPGKAIELFTTMVEYQGKSVPAIRVAPPANAPQQAAPAQPHSGLDDEIPF